MNTKRQINPIKNTSFRLFADIVSDETRIETEKYGSYNGRKKQNASQHNVGMSKISKYV